MAAARSSNWPLIALIVALLVALFMFVLAPVIDHTYEMELPSVCPDGQSQIFSEYPDNWRCGSPPTTHP